MPVNETNISMESESVVVEENEMGSYTASCTFHMKSHAHTPLTRTVTYDMGELERLWGLGNGSRLGYIVRTGGLWQGNIGSADIRFKFRDNPRSNQNGRYQLRDHPEALFSLSYPGQAHWLSDTEVSWHFDNWNSTRLSAKTSSSYRSTSKRPRTRLELWRNLVKERRSKASE